MNPTGLPELSKPLRDLTFDQKCETLRFQNLKHLENQLKNHHNYLLLSVLKFLLKGIPDKGS